MAINPRPITMSIDYSSVRNHQEASVWDAVSSAAERYPGLADDGELLADVACVALNRLPPRYIRYAVDYAFYLSNDERIENERRLAEAVEFAFGFVQARAAMRARR
jgi:Late competence development protein ComFB